jgi:hypothetical protein
MLFIEILRQKPAKLFLKHLFDFLQRNFESLGYSVNLKDCKYVVNVIEMALLFANSLFSLFIHR